MKKLEIEVGTRFKRLVTLGLSYAIRKNNGKSYRVIDCLCDCGNTKTCEVGLLSSGHAASCGCARTDGKIHETHGMHKSRIYRIWKNMKLRCCNETVPAYQNYGAKGIRLCNDWKDFVNFYKWAMENGYNDELTIDRIDNDKGYSPENCRCATRKQQQQNKKACQKNGENACSSKYKGVTKKEFRGREDGLLLVVKWRSQIKKDGKYYFLGIYDTEEEAALAYNKKAQELFGEFSCLNKIECQDNISHECNG